MLFVWQRLHKVHDISEDLLVAISSGAVSARSADVIYSRIYKLLIDATLPTAQLKESYIWSSKLQENLLGSKFGL